MKSPIWSAVVAAARQWGRKKAVPKPEVRIGLALGGGFARGIAHIGVLRVFERQGIPVHSVSGVSAGSIIASGFASGSDSKELERIARAMKFKDVAAWTLNRLGFMNSDRMEAFLRRILKVQRFEEMRIPLAVVATDLQTGEPVVFRQDDVTVAVRASCAYPGLFLPVKKDGRYLVDGGVAMEVPALPLRAMGATHVIGVGLSMAVAAPDPSSVFAVVNRSFQILQHRTEPEWRRQCDLVIKPDVAAISWDGFTSADQLIEAGEKAAEAALPQVREWLNAGAVERVPGRIPGEVALVEGAPGGGNSAVKFWRS